MKTKHFLIGGLATLSLIMVSSCTDSSYDLDNVDTTARFKANDLIVPINLDVLTFDQVLDLDENSEIVKMKDPNGRDIYAVKKEGTFNSSEINVDKITAHPSIGTTTAVLSQTGMLPSGFTAEFDIIGVAPTVFTANATDIDEAILRVDTLGVASTLTTTLTLSAPPGSGSIDWANAVTIKNLKIEFPAGIKCTTDKGTFIETNPTMKDYSLLDLSSVNLKPNSSGKIEITLNVTDYYTVTKSDNTKNIDFDPNAQTLSISDQVKIQTGTIELYNASASFPSSINFKIAPTMDDLVVNTFTGSVNYKVKDFDIDPIDLNNLPDFLNQEGTKLGLENPQIYLGLNNPVGNFQNQKHDDYVYLQTDFVMTPERDGVVAAPCALPAPFVIPGGTTAEQQFVMSPKNPSPNFYPGYGTPTFVSYPKLKDVLTETDGIPTKITVKASPELPTQDVSKFTLGTDLGKVDGRYTFYAPLQLSNNTTIHYTDTLDGWNDEDVDKLNITALKLNMTVTTEVSFPIELTIVPTTFNSKPIPGVTANTVTLPAGAMDYPFEVVFHGEIAHLDGLLLKAKVVNGDDQTILGPTMKILMKNSKATLTGYYEKEL